MLQNTKAHTKRKYIIHLSSAEVLVLNAIQACDEYKLLPINISPLSASNRKVPLMLTRVHKSIMTFFFF